MKAEQKSLTDQFITIDALIKQNQMSSALKELKKAEKRVYEAWSYLGLYKRYVALGETERSEKILKKALKSYPENSELIAVYTDFLIDNNKFEDAIEIGKKLVGTDYASLYSEAVLRQIISGQDDKKSSPADYDFYTSNDFYNIFFDAYLISKNPMWIRNCGVLDLRLGRYERIGDIAPTVFENIDDAYFWALALYDAGKYYECIDALGEAQNFLFHNENIDKAGKCSQVEVVALASDAYMNISDMEQAEKIRQDLIFNIVNNSSDLKESDKDQNNLKYNVDITNPLLPVIMTNSAIWAYNQRFYDECADLLFFIVNKWPDYVPGLVLYSDFAYNSNLQRSESNEMKALRDAGLATIEMEEYDNRRKIPISDAKYRVDEALKRTNNPYLNIVQFDLKYKLDKTLNQNDKYRDLWEMLEDGYFNGDSYKNLLVQYALNMLLMNKEYDDAWNLFKHYINSVSDFSDDRDFWEQFIENISFYDIGIVEFGGWFAAYNKLRNETIRILEYCVYESGGILEDGYISQKASYSSCMNLADAYYSIGKKEKALDLYGRIGGRESKKDIRAEIFYRIACIYASMGDNKNALRSAEYACSLYPENPRASLLKDELKSIN